MLQSRVWFGTTVAIAVGRPSSGGVLTLNVNAVDLIFLNVSRFEPTVVPNNVDLKADADAWCATLRRLAPRWWRSLEDRRRAFDESDIERFQTSVEIAKGIRRLAIHWRRSVGSQMSRRIPGGRFRRIRPLREHG